MPRCPKGTRKNKNKKTGKNNTKTTKTKTKIIPNSIQSQKNKAYILTITYDENHNITKIFKKKATQAQTKLFNDYLKNGTHSSKFTPISKTYDLYAFNSFFITHDNGTKVLNLLKKHYIARKENGIF
jgi:hypothetical protein